MKRFLLLLTGSALVAATLVPGVASAQAAYDPQEALLEARPAAQFFGRQIGFSPDEITQLSAVAVLLARLHGMDIAQTSEQLSDALLGNQASAYALGLDLDPSFVAYTQIDGSTREVFDGLSTSTQAWLRYKALLGQLGSVVNAATA